MPSAPKPRKPKPPVGLPEWDAVEWPTRSANVLVIDQTLTNSGWALMYFGAAYVPQVVALGTIHTRPIDGLSGFAENFVRGEQVYGAARALLMDTKPDVILYEMPAVKGFRADSSALAAMSLRCAAASLGYRNSIGMMQNQHVKKWMTGLGAATKQMVRAQVKLALPGMDDRLNEHTSDALALGIVAALDGTLSSILDSSTVEPSPIGKVS